MPSSSERHVALDHGEHRGQTADRARNGAAAGSPGTGKARGTGVTGAVLIGTGVFLLALAVLLPLVVYPRLVVLPADPDMMQIQTTEDGTALLPDLSVPAGARVAKHIPVSIRTYVTRDRSRTAKPGNVVWQLGTRVTADGQLLQARIEHVSLDESTAEPSNCCGDSLSTEQSDPGGTPIRHMGLITFPFNSKKTDYQVWDVNLGRQRTAVYSGTGVRDGIQVNLYTASTSWSPVGTRELPGALFGLPTPSVTAEGEYMDRRTYFVEPNSGATLDVSEKLDQRYVFAGKSVTAISAQLESSSLPQTRLDQVRQSAVILPWLRARASIVLVVGALVAFSGATVLIRRRTR